MSKRLASFGGPSAPTSSPIAGQSTTPTPTKYGGKKKPTPASPNPRSPRPKTDFSGSGISVHTPRKAKAPEETEIQRLVRLTLKRASLTLEEWEKRGTRSRLQDAKSMMDEVTELDNTLESLSSPGMQPRFRVIGRKMYNIQDLREALQIRSLAMSTDFSMLVKRANKLEQALTEFAQTHGVVAAEQTPLWAGKTWSLGQHVLHMHNILRPLNRFLLRTQILSERIIAYGSVAGFSSDDLELPESERPVPAQGATIPTFEETRGAMVLWTAEAKSIEELIKEWNEMCALEVVGWDRKPGPEIDSSDEDEDDATG